MARKRYKTNTAAGAAESLHGAYAKVEPPGWVTLPKDALPFWYSVTRARPPEHWTEPDLEMAAELARTKQKIERINTELEIEGDVIKNDRGTPIVNPKNSLLETLTRRAVALSRMLHVHAEATVGESKDTRKAADAHNKARNTAKKIDDDDLIAKPKH